MKKGFKTAVAVMIVGTSLATTTAAVNAIDTATNSGVVVAQASKKSKRLKRAIATIQENFDGIADVYYANKMICIKPTDPQFIDETAAVLAGEEDSSDWDEMTNSLDKLSKNLYEKAHVKKPVAIVNPKNTDKILYAAYDGETLYDVVNGN